MQYKYHRHQRIVRSLRVFFTGFGLFLCIELFILLVFNPYHVLGEGNIYSHFSLLPFLLVHGLLFSLFLFLDLSAALLLASGITRPLALISYLRTVRKTHQEVNKQYFPLTGLQLITADIPDQNSTDLSGRNQGQHTSILELVQQQDTNQMLLGVPGAGKTTILTIYEYNMARQHWAILFGRKKLPVFIPMNDYNLFLQEHTQAVSQPHQDIYGEGTLFHYLSERQLEGVDHLLPYLKKLMEQGRVMFLCDGLNEVDSTCLTFVSTTFSRLMNQEPANHIVMTCREVDYSEQRGLKEMVKTNSVKPLLVNPLTHEQIEEFVEEYIHWTDRELRHTKKQIMDKIDFSSLRVHCKNPMMLVALIDIIEDTENGHEKQLNTRGQLMHEFVMQLIRRERKRFEESKRIHELPEEGHVLQFLSEVACAARWAGDRNAIQLPAADARKRSDKKVRYLMLANALQHWLDDYPAQVPFAISEKVQPLHEQFDQETYAKLIGFALESELIEIKTSGKLSFKHEMVAEYFVAHYFWHMDSLEQPPLSLHERLFTDEGRWSEPIIIWAGLVDDPRKLAERFAAFGNKNPGYILEAVTFSLNCMGVLWTPIHDQGQQRALPHIVEEALSKAIVNAKARVKLAGILNSCVHKGGTEAYYSLLASLTTPGIEDLLVLLDKEIVPDILFEHLETISNRMGYDQDVSCLMHVLGQFGAISVERAALLSEDLPERNIRLRCAAINILGHTGVDSAVEPLIACLCDKDNAVYKHAINALIHLKAEYSLAPVTHLLENHTSTPDGVQVHLAALYIVNRFLIKAKAEHQLSQVQFTRTLQVLVPVLSSNYTQEVQQEAKEIFIALGSTAAKPDRRKETIEALIAHLSPGDAQMARNIVQVLIKVGPATTPFLLNHLPRGEKSRRVYIIEVIEGVRDQQSLSLLLRLVADPDVQQEVAHALQVYAPESIEGLIKQVLTDEKNLVAEKSAAILKNIGDQAVLPIVDMLSPTIPDRPLLLVRVLEDIRDERAIPKLIELLEKPEVEPGLMQAIIHALGQFEDKRVIAPLLSILENPNFYNEATQSLIHLDGIAVDDVITALVVKENPVTIQRLKQVLYQMEPFPEKQLIAQIQHVSAEQAQRIMDIFIMKNEAGANMLVGHFHHDDAHTQNQVHQALDGIPARYVAPTLATKLNNPVMRTDIIRYLLHREPEQVIPVLVQNLPDEDRGDAARDGLLQFGPVVIPYMIPGLDAHNDTARERARQIIVNLVHQQPEEISHVVQLLKSSLPQLALESLLDALTNTFADISIPALKKGLENPDLTKNVAEAFKRLVQKHNGQSDRKLQALQALREALYEVSQQQGAKSALVEIGESAIPIVGELITDSNRSVAPLAQDILRDIGGPALAFIWAIYNDTSRSERRDIALSIFHSMTTIKITATLLDFLRSTNPQHITMGLGLLLERVRGEFAAPNTDQKIMPILFEYLNNDDPSTSRIIAWLLLLNSGYAVSSLEMELKKHPNHSDRLVHIFLLLGKEAEGTLAKILQQNTTSMNPNLKAEVAGVLGMMTKRQEVRQLLANYALSISRNGYGTTNHITNAQELAVSLRALGGLLAGGRWKFAELEELQHQSSSDSPQRELLDILLGKLYTPIIKERERELLLERHGRQNEKKEFEKEVSRLKGEIKDLRGNYSILQTNYQNLESKNGDLIGISSSLQTSNESLRTQNQFLATANGTLENRISHLEMLLRMQGIDIL